MQTESENNLSAEEQQACSADDSTYSHVLKYTWLFGGVQGLSVLMGVIRTKLVALFLGPSGLALINIYNNVMGLIGQSTNLGLTISAVKDVAAHHASGHREALERSVEAVRTWTMLTALLGSLAAMLLSPLLSRLTFGNADYTWDFLLLAPMVGMLTLTGGEMAILKGLKQLKRVALVSAFGAVATVVVNAPLFYFFGQHGIVPSLLIVNLVVLLIHLRYSTRTVPWHCSLLSRSVICYGIPFVKLGAAYVLAATFTQGTEYVVRTILLRMGGMDVVGYYNCGYMLMVGYASLVFVAVESDYFPRLSAIVEQHERMIHTVNQQVEICVLLIAPLLVLFVAVMPFAVRALFSAEFVPALSMSVCAVFYMFFKALTMPVAYLALARGDSRTYLMMEVAYNVFLVLVVPLAYYFGGLQTTGWALSAAGLFDFLIVNIFYCRKYAYRFQKTCIPTYIVHFLLLVVAVVSALCIPAGLFRYGAGAAVVICSSVLSFRRLSQVVNVRGYLDKLRGIIRRG